MEKRVPNLLTSGFDAVTRRIQGTSQREAGKTGGQKKRGINDPIQTPAW
jgi:hypothetical protein